MSQYHPPLRPTPPAGIPITPRVLPPLDQDAPVCGSDDFPLSADELHKLVRSALEEDQAFNDVSTVATVVSTRHVRASVVAREDGVVCGIPFACEAFRQLDNAITIRIEAEDGSRVRKGDVVLSLTGHARGILSAERVALNFMQRLSGIASLTARFAEAVKGTSAKVLDTRKTTPGWRKLEKYAVRMGGGVNHRMDLRSGVLIKDNHIAAIGGDIGLAVSRARALASKGTPIQVECDTLEQVARALDAGADWILLDNMTDEMLREAVSLCRDKAVTEASGGVTLESVARIASTGVDRISAGVLTHSPRALDLALDFDGR